MSIRLTVDADRLHFVATRRTAASSQSLATAAAKRAAAAADEARACYDRALELTDELGEAERAELLFERGNAKRSGGDWLSAIVDWEAALPGLEAAKKTDLVTLACWQLAYLGTWRNALDEAEGFAERGLASAGDGASVARCRLLAILGHIKGMAEANDEADRLIGQAISMAEELGDERLLGAEVLYSRLYQYENTAQASKLLEAGERAIELTRRSGRPWDVSNAVGATLMTLGWNGQFARGREQADAIEPLAIQQGDTGTIIHIWVARAQDALSRGDLREARECARRCTQFTRDAGLPWFSITLSLEGAIATLAGDWPYAREAVEEAVRSKLAGNYAGIEEAYLLRCLTYAGEPRALDLLDALEPRLPRSGRINGNGSWTILVEWAEAAVLLGQPERAARLHPLVLQLRAQGTVALWGCGLTERVAGIAAAAGKQWAEAEAHFTEALRQADELAHIPERAEVRYWHARMLLDRREPGDLDRAEALLRAADEVGRQVGMPKHLEMVEALRADIRAARRRGFVGRDAERSRLDEMLERARRGRGGLVLLGGEPGVGKTRLASEILEDGRERGLLALAGHASEDQTAPFLIATEILEAMVRLVPAPELRQMLGSSASELSRLLPELRQRYADLQEPVQMPPEMQQRQLFRSVLEFLTRASAERPLVMLLDDLHWADESSLLLLEHIAARLAELPILMIGTYRDVEADVGKPFARVLATLVRQRLAERMTVKAFDEGSVAEILTALGGSAPPEGLAHAIHAATEGNVFFIEETFRHLSEEGLLFDDAGAWKQDIDLEQLDVPEGVRLVTARRLERLGESTRKVLSVASVIGLRFAVPVLEAAVPDADAVLDALEEAEAAHLLTPSEGGRELRYEFVHALARQTLLSELSPLRRQRMHLSIADAIERTAGSHPEGRAADIAHHLVEAGSSADRERTIRWLKAAGENAAAATALEEAYRYFDTALSVQGEPPSEGRGDLLQRRGSARMALGDSEGCVSDLYAAIAVYEAVGAKGKAANATASLGELLCYNARPADALAAVVRALALIGEGGSPERSRLLSTQALAMIADPDEAGPFHEAAAAMARRLDDRVLLADVLQRQALSDQLCLYGDQLARRAAEVVALRRELGQPWEVANGLWMLKNGLANSGRFEEAARVDDDLMPLAERQGQLGSIGLAHMIQPYIDLARGDLEGVSESLRLSRKYFEMAGFPWGGWADGYESVRLLLAGQNEEARQALDRLAATGFPKGTSWTGNMEGYWLSGKAHLGDGDILEEYRKCASYLPRPGRAMSGGPVVFLTLAIEALVLAGEREEAGKLYPLLAEFVAKDIGRFAFTAGLHERFAGIAAAAAGDWENAERHFQHGLKVVDEERPHRVDQARIRYWYGRMLLDRGGPGDFERARELLARARELGKDMGLHGLIAEIDALAEGSQATR